MQYEIQKPHLALVFTIVTLLAVAFFGRIAMADITFIEDRVGDHFVYHPPSPGKYRNILVIAHGSRNANERSISTAERYLNRWIKFADRHGLILVVPVFDDSRFGNRKGGYGGYRGLFGREINADQFVLALVDRQRPMLENPSEKFLIYGHSAGAQFAVRFTVQHPDTISLSVVSAAGRYSYPTLSAKWPYGAGELRRSIEWADGTVQKVSAKGNLRKYAEAGKSLFVLVGSKDTDRQPERPAHRGKNRVELLISWMGDMNENVADYVLSNLVRGYVAPNIGHNSMALTPYAQKVLEEHMSR